MLLSPIQLSRDVKSGRCPCRWTPLPTLGEADAESEYGVRQGLQDEDERGSPSREPDFLLSMEGSAQEQLISYLQHSLGLSGSFSVSDAIYNECNSNFGLPRHQVHYCIQHAS